MRILKAPVLSGEDDCPYLEGKRFRQEYFAGCDLDGHQFRQLLHDRWRRFGLVFFRPVCPDCRGCEPLRVIAGDFRPSRSQKRVLRKNEETEVVFRELEYRDDLYDIYEKHSRLRFDQGSSPDEFVRNFYNPAVPSFQSEYFIDGRLAGFGILDASADGLSSVYFCFDPEFEEYSLGTFSALKEIDECRRLDLPYYYLGYYIEECGRMSYKGRFKPFELLRSGIWAPPPA